MLHTRECSILFSYGSYDILLRQFLVVKLQQLEMILFELYKSFNLHVGQLL